VRRRHYPTLLTTGYVANRVVVAHREERDAFSLFGREVVTTATERGWRYSIVGGDDEGMALYVRRTEFAWPDEAAAEWNAGKLDALVVAENKMPDLLARLQSPAPKTILTSKPAGRYKNRYLLLARSSSAEPSAP
jgi:hypothetical protein